MDRSALALRRCVERAGLPLVGWVLAAAVAAASQGGARLDQVHVFDAKSGRRTVVTGTVVENALSKVRLERDGKETRLESIEVEGIEWGEVSPAFREAQIFFGRGDFENAAAKFRQATDVDERAVVKAAARWRAGASLLEHGATDPSKYAEALSEFERFLADHPDDRAVPDVRAMQARAKLLSGDAAGAGALYRSLFEAGASETPSAGYDRMLCLRAGLAAAESLLAAGDTLAARELFGVVETSVGSMQSQVTQGTPAAQDLADLAAEADLGEGYVLIANGQQAQAETFFQARLSNADKATAVTRFGAMMGLAEGYAVGRKFADARVLFARVAALDFTNRDRAARALLRLTEATMELKESTAAERGRRWLDEILASYGDTPSARVARELRNQL